MPEASANRLIAVIDERFDDLLRNWIADQLAALRRGQIAENDLRVQCTELLQLIRRALVSGAPLDLEAQAWSGARDLLARISVSRAQQGFTPSETATFVLSLKRPLFGVLHTESKDADSLADDIWTATLLLDQLALHTTEVYIRARQELISRQQQDMLELSTPVVKLWDGVLALPMIGTLDSSRTQVVMETLLQRIVETGSDVAILDITGVPTVDTLTAQHLLKTVTAARLMGAECIISGIRPQIAQTIVHLGVDLGDVITKATLADAFKLALSRLGLTVARQRVAPSAAPASAPTAD
ncbi:MAG TPA: STAS domain-containing protein [Gemmatimonadaceae bacterium]